MLQFPPAASLDLRCKDSLSASQRHRRRHRLCDTSCPSAPAQQLLRVAPGLRRLSSPRNLHLPFPPLSLLGLSSREERSRSARRHPPPKRQGPRPKIALDPAPPASSWSAGQEEERVESRHGRTAHQKTSREKPLGTPFYSGCRGNCVCCYRVRTSAHATVRCDSGKNKTQTFSKREQFSSSVPHECPASTPIRSKTPAFQRRGLHLGAGRERSRSALRGDDVAGKRSHRNGSSSFERVRLLQPLLPRPQKGWRPPAHPRSQMPESRPHETAVQDDHAEADPLADSHRGLVLFSGPERRILSHPDSPPSQTILEIHLRGSGLPVHGPTLWAVSGPPYFYEVHGRGSFPSETDGNPHSQLPRRLAHSGPVRGGTTFTQNPHPQPLRAPGAQGQFRQKRTVSQPTSIVPGYSSGLSSHESGDSARTRSGHSETRGPPSRATPLAHSKCFRECWALWPQHRQCYSWACSACAPFNAGWNHGFHTMHGVTDACISGWIRPVWQPWPHGRTHGGWRRAWPWGWSTPGKLSRQTPPTQVGGCCTKANRPLSELTQLLTAAPWPVPLRRDLLSQANGTIWHPRPELWALYIWPLNGSLLASQSEC